MPDTLLRVFVLVAGLLLPKEHPGILQHNDDIIIGMQQREGVLQRERAKLEHQLDAVAMDTMLEHQPDGLQSHSSLQPLDQNLGPTIITDSNLSAQEGQGSTATGRFSAEGEKETGEQSGPADQNLSQGEEAPQLEEEEEEPSGLSEQLPSQQEGTTDHQDHPAGPEASRAKLTAGKYDVPESIHSDSLEAPAVEDSVRVPPQGDCKYPKVNAEGCEHQCSDRVEALEAEAEGQPSKDDYTAAPEGNAEGFKHPGVSDSGKKLLRHEQQPDTDVMRGPSTTTKQTSSGSDYMWYLYNAYSVFSLIFFLVGFLRGNSQDQEVVVVGTPQLTSRAAHSIRAEVHVPDQGILMGFYERYVHVPAHESQRVCEFVEGFVDDLLAAMRETSNDPADMEVEDFMEVGSLYESWGTGRTLTCDLWVPLAPRKPYSFQVQLMDHDETYPCETHGYRRVKMLKGGRTVTNGCPCSQTSNDNDMLCLLHTNDTKREDEKDVVTDATNGPLCSDNTPYLSRVAVARWFRSAVRKAWELTSHKYELELASQSRGSLRVRFRSGRSIHFSITPVVRFEDTDMCLVSHLGPKWEDSALDVQWPLSFARYERSLLRCLGKRLPQDACHLRCLQTLSFLNKKQMELSGDCRLSSHHLKTVLLHLLLEKQPSEWGSEHFAERLRDALDFLKTSLQKRWLSHAVVGNPLLPPEVRFPAHLCQSKPLNVLQPLLSQDHQYAKTVQHFEEMLKNMPMLIQEYMEHNVVSSS